MDTIEIKLSELITPGRALAKVNARSKKHALEILSEMLAETLPPDPDAPDRLSLTNSVMEALVQREKLGSTALGEGIALPHASLAQVEHLTAAVVTLVHPVDFDTPDGQPVDVMMALIAPLPASPAHREIVERASLVLSDHTGKCPLREAQSSTELHAALECIDKAILASYESEAAEDN
jgi:PTS system nitrogen regulatory IIA component